MTNFPFIQKIWTFAVYTLKYGEFTIKDENNYIYIICDYSATLR